MVRQLKNITLCAVDCATPSLAVNALEKSAAALDFTDVILFSDQTTEFSGRTVLINKLSSRDAYSAFMLKRLVEFVETPYVLIVQWDGFVVDPARWTLDFTGCDYVGAWWGWFPDGLNVGNGGFCLRSRKLLEACAALIGDSPPVENEDTVICRRLRPRLESDWGVTFAPRRVANLFSYERTPPAFPTFGFHGLFNFWRHLDDSEVLDNLARFPQGTIKSPEFVELMLIYLQQQKFAVFAPFFARLLDTEKEDGVLERLGALTRSPEQSQKIVSLGMKLIR